jgi:ABC-type antimicrobial peptide transport system permease subunit
MTLLSSFAVLGLVLAATGIYGVIAFAVAHRTHEFGVRIALGGGPSDVVRMVLGSGIRITAVGLAAGLACALATTRLLSSLLFEIKPWDPATFGTTSILVSGVALGTCWLAARRAAAVDLLVALRCE